MVLSPVLVGSPGTESSTCRERVPVIGVEVRVVGAFLLRQIRPAHAPPPRSTPVWLGSFKSTPVWVG